MTADRSFEAGAALAAPSWAKVVGADARSAVATSTAESGRRAQERKDANEDAENDIEIS